MIPWKLLKRAKRSVRPYKKRIFDYLADDKLRVNIGGGMWYRKGWKVMDWMDGEYTLIPSLVDYNYNLMSLKPFPFASESVSVFYTSHTLEHIPIEYHGFIAREIYRCLIDGGYLRIVVPDFDMAEDAFCQKDEAFFTAKLGLDLAKLFEDFYKTDRLGHGHSSPWTYSYTKGLLKTVGFKCVYRSNCGCSRLPEMRSRSKSRANGFDTTHPEFSLFVEAKK